MMYLAMHDALNAVVPTFQQYAFFGADKSAHPIAAVAQAARDVLNHIYPAREAENDAELAFWLSQIPDGPRKTRGIALGTASAAAIIALRASDNMLVPESTCFSTHSSGPTVWGPTPYARFRAYEHPVADGQAKAELLLVRVADAYSEPDPEGLVDLKDAEHAVGVLREA